MSKSKGILALLGTLVFSVPAVAATTIADPEIGLQLIGLQQIQPNSYELKAGTLALLEVTAHRGDTVLVYAAPLDKWGQPDFGLMVFLVEPQMGNVAGQTLKFFTVPPEAAGMTFKVQAIAYDPVNLFESSPALTIAVSSEIAQRPPHVVQAAQN